MSAPGQLVRSDAPAVAIVGTADIISAVARVAEARLVGGQLHCSYSGSDVDWDSQSVRRRGAWRLFIDENGALVSEEDVALQLEDGTLQTPARPGGEGA